MAALTNCKTCGREVAVSARICPGCGAKLRTGLFSKIALGAIGLIFLVAIAAVVFNLSPELRTERTAQKVQELVTMNTVHIDYQLASVDSQIKENNGKAILVDVVVTTTEKLGNRYKITSVMNNAGLNVKGVFFYLYPLSPQDQQVITNLKIGDTIQVKGIISGMLLGNLELDPAILAPTAPNVTAESASRPTPITTTTPPESAVSAEARDTANTPVQTTDLGSPLTEEALSFAADYVGARIVDCSGAVILQIYTWRNSYSAGSYHFIQLIEPRVAVQPLKQITDIDKLNKLDWAGRLIIAAKAYRDADVHPRAKWSEWSDPNNDSFAAGRKPGLWVDLEKRDGQWKVLLGDKGWPGFTLMDPSDCKQVPPTD